MELLLELVRKTPGKKWLAVERNLLLGLMENANGKEYDDLNGVVTDADRKRLAHLAALRARQVG